MIWRILLFVLGGPRLASVTSDSLAVARACASSRRTLTWRPFTVLSWVTSCQAVFVDAGTRLATAGAMLLPSLSLVARSAPLARPAQGLRWRPDGC